jgi:hypothetical protein
MKSTKTRNEVSTREWVETPQRCSYRCYKESALGLRTVGPTLAALWYECWHLTILLHAIRSIVVPPALPIARQFEHDHYHRFIELLKTKDNEKVKVWIKMVLVGFEIRRRRSNSQGRQMWRFLMEEELALMTLRFPLFLLHNNRIFYIQNAQLYMQPKEKRRRGEMYERKI